MEINLRDYGLDDKKASSWAIIRSPWFYWTNLKFGNSMARPVEDLCPLLQCWSIRNFLQVAVSSAGITKTTSTTAGVEEAPMEVEERISLQRAIHFCLSDRKESRSGKESKRSFDASHGDGGIIMYILQTPFEWRMQLIAKAESDWSLVMLPGQRHGYGDMVSISFGEKWETTLCSTCLVIITPPPVDMMEMLAG